MVNCRSRCCPYHTSWAFLLVWNLCASRFHLLDLYKCLFSSRYGCRTLSNATLVLFANLFLPVFLFFPCKLYNTLYILQKIPLPHKKSCITTLILYLVMMVLTVVMHLQTSALVIFSGDNAGIRGKECLLLIFCDCFRLVLGGWILSFWERRVV